MSAFYDISIYSGFHIPGNQRKGNQSWEKAGSFWKSLPLSGNETYINEYTDGGNIVVIIGQLYEDISIATVFERVKQYVAGHTTTFEDPSGHYVIYFYDEVQQKHHIFTNRLGTYHVYYATGVNAISTYYLGLAKESITKQLNWEAISCFFATGFFPDDATYLQDIRIVEPASWYCFDEDLNLLSRKRYWNWTYDPKPLSVNDWCDKLDNVLHQTLGVSIKDKKIALPISGGLDSRTLAGVLTQNDQDKKSLLSFSYGYSKSSPEISIAKKIAAARNIAFDSYVVPDYLFNELDAITESVELFQYITGTRQAAMLDILQQNADVVVGGHWGDVWLDDMKMKSYDSASFEKAFQNKIVKKGSVRLLQDICAAYVPKYNEVVDDYFHRHAQQYRHIDDLDFRMKIYKTDQWSFRWTVPSLRMYQAAIMPVLPFYDKRIVDLFCNTPTSIVKNRELQVAYLKDKHPDLARIKWQEYDSNLYNYKTFNNRNLIYRGVKKVQRTLSSVKRVSRNWEVFYLNDKGRQQLEADLLHSSLTEVVPEASIRNIISDFYKDPSAANGYAISMLHTFAQFMKTVF